MAIKLIISFVLIAVVMGYFLNRKTPTKYTTVEYIQMNGYPVESHYVTTSDGYILNLHRIPNRKSGKINKKVVLLEHGILLSSIQWVLTGPGKALAYLLADEGYDVWMGNARGNVYSRNHTVFNPDADTQFWNFTWHEIGINDLPACIDYILEETNKTALYYVGFSQGTTAMYVLLSIKPEYNEKIKAYAHLAPAAFMGHVKSPMFRIPAAMPSVFQTVVPKVMGEELLPSNWLICRVMSVICVEGLGTKFCENLYYALFGYSPSETNQTLVPELSLHMPAGAAFKEYVHYLQEVISGHFRQYDYGKEGNLIKYGSSTPPDYELSKVVAPGYLIYSSDDLVVDHIIDIPRLYTALGNCTKTYCISEPFSHQDFLTGNNASNIVYPAVLKFFSQH